MSSNQENDALSWAGDDDPTLVAGEADQTPDPSGTTVASATPELPEGWTVARSETAPAAKTASSTVLTPTEPESDELDAPPSSAALVGMGVLGGIYMLYTVGWFIGTSRVGNPIADPLGQFMFSVGAWLAVIAPLVWFGAVYWLTSDRPRLRMLWLFIGVVLLAPIPFIFGAGTI